MRHDELKGVLQSLHDSGGLTPERVVDTARDPGHPLHPEFEWDDGLAAELHRRNQARALIRRVKIVYGQDGQGRNKSTRYFVNLRPSDSPREPVYQPVEEVLMDPVQKALLLRQAKRDWLTFKSKYRHLEEFAAIIADAEEDDQAS